MAKMNGVPDIDLNDYKQRETNDVIIVKESILDVLKTKRLLLRILNMCFCWCTVTMVYYGLSLNATNLAGNPYSNFLLVSLVEIPGKSKFDLSYNLGNNVILKKIIFDKLGIVTLA